MFTRYLAILAMLAAPVTQAQPYWFQMGMNCNYNPGVATCVVHNAGLTPMYCEMRADGQMASGHFVYGYLNDWVPPGQYRYVYVNSAGPANPFIGAQGGGRCRL